jgi:hypothetical protein
MEGIMARLGCLLEIISMVALFMLVVLPVIPIFEDSEFFDNMLKPVLCPDGTIRREQYQTYDDDDGTGYSMNVYCEDSEGDETDVTGAWIGIGIAAFLIPFLIGLFMMINGFNKGVRGMMGGMPHVDNEVGYGTPASFGMPMQDKPKNQPKTMSEKLQELEQAKQQGLLTESEYQQARQEILNG